MHQGSSSRKRLIADIQRLVGMLLLRDVSDPRIQGLVVTRVEDTRGGHTLTLFVHRCGETDVSECMQRLQRMQPHFEHELRSALKVRRLPQIHFAWDVSLDDADRVLRLLKGLDKS